MAPKREVDRAPDERDREDQDADEDEQRLAQPGLVVVPRIGPDPRGAIDPRLGEPSERVHGPRVPGRSPWRDRRFSERRRTGTARCWSRVTTCRWKEVAMTHERAPARTQSLLGDEAETTSWEMARERLANPELPRTCWLATTRPDGRPHLMPVIAFWIDDAMHIVAGEGTQKARNIAADGRCAIATGSTTLPSLDLVIEGRAEPLTDHDAVRHVAEFLKDQGWPLEPRGTRSRVRTPRPRVHRRTRSSGSFRRGCSASRA